MIKLLAYLLAVLNKALGLWHDTQVRQQVKDAVDVEIAKTETAVAVADPIRDQRLRRRFDAASASDHTK